MKKILLGLGSVATVVAPIVAVVSCADEKPEYKDSISRISTTYAHGQDSTTLEKLLTEFANGNKASKHSEIMTAIGMNDGGEIVLMGEITFVLVGNILTKTQLFKVPGKTVTITTVYTIALSTI